MSGQTASAKSAGSVDLAVLTVTNGEMGPLERTALTLKSELEGQISFFQVIKSCKALPQNVHWLSPESVYVSPDSGIYSAMNQGLDIVQGAASQPRAIIFLNAGDTFLKGAGELIREAIHGKPRRLVAFQRFELAGERIQADGFRSAILPNMPTNHQSIIFPWLPETKSLRYNEGFEVAADYDFYLRYRRRCDLTRLPKPIVRFERGGFHDRKRDRLRREILSINMKRFSTALPGVLYFLAISMRDKLEPTSPSRGN